jgi:hypothetical protein
MSRERYRKLTRWAVVSAITLPLLVVSAAWAGGVALLLLLLWLGAWGQYQADVTLNPNLDEVGRTRWRIGLWVTPFAIVVYWLRHIRPRRTFD